MDKDAAGFPVVAPTAATTAPAPAPPAAIGLLLATNLGAKDKGARVAWRLPRGAGGLRGSGGEGGRTCEAGGLGGVRLPESRAWLGTVASTASPGWGAGALRGGRLGRARLQVDARRDKKIKTSSVHEKYIAVFSNLANLVKVKVKKGTLLFTNISNVFMQVLEVTVNFSRLSWSFQFAQCSHFGDAVGVACRRRAARGKTSRGRHSLRRPASLTATATAYPTPRHRATTPLGSLLVLSAPRHLLSSPPRRHWVGVQRASPWSLQALAASSRKPARPHPQVWFLFLLLLFYLSGESYWEEPPL